jgi:hypothetical protein
MGKYIDVINEKPDARKKGFRMIVKGIELDDNGQIVGIDCDYSTYRQYGCFRVFGDMDTNGIVLHIDANRVEVDDSK